MKSATNIKNTPYNAQYSPFSLQKSPISRSFRMNIKSSSVARVEFSSSVNRSSDSGLWIPKRTFLSPQKERKEVSPIPSLKTSRIVGKTFTEGNVKNSNTPKPLKSWQQPEPKSSQPLQILTKAETEKFSPYMVITKKPVDEKRSKLASFLKKADDRKPSKPLLNIPETVAPNPATPKEPNYFTFALGKGNNDAIVRKVMTKRYWWKETMPLGPNYHFCWYQTNKPINFALLNGPKGGKRVANHFEFNKEIGIKSNLLKNLQVYCERTNMELFKITPITFILDMHDPHYNAELMQFSKYFKEFSKRVAQTPAATENVSATVETEETKTQSDEKDKEKEKDKKKKDKKEKKDKKDKEKESTIEKMMTPRVGKPMKFRLPETYYDGCNLWLLKPTDYNRGRGINLFNKLSTLESHLKSFLANNEEQAAAKKMGSSSPTKTQNSNLNLVKSHRFVVQKYIEKPLLIDNRKFDARVWVLLDQDMNLYWFKEAYIRLSSEPFSINEATIEDKYIHLTNNAVQKYGKNYGKHESGNIISFDELEKILPKDNPKITLASIKERVKELIKISMESVKVKINACDRKYSFEIFGYDFILDAEFNVWIIEVNSNPCIEESNDLLKMLVPRMLDDAFQLTLDKIFVPTSKNFKVADAFKNDIPKSFPVTGYTDEENLWSYITSIKDNSTRRESKLI